MDKIEVSGPNAQQIEFWNGEAGSHWSERDDQMSLMLRPLGAEAIALAAPDTGEAVLDIGCGCGDTTLELAVAVGATGRVVGVDISAPMLVTANAKRAQLPAELDGNCSFELADASSHDFTPAVFDLLFSRFGVMFFADPATAFANMRGALKPGGRLAFMCWGPAEQNDWIMVPMQAAREHLPAPEPAEPRAPGPFAFADTDYVSEFLQAAGFTNIEFEPTQPNMRMGNGSSLDKSVEFFMEMGPVSSGLVNQPDAVRSAVRESVRAAIAGSYVDGYVELQGQCWLVTASNPG
ncbi:class I SAM-dependent methyltransferase [Candidatus Litorirhabdus singularis]|nr:class I SAM-dependent methyltransferase [Candidatus Litorirhabdus singularis]